MIFNALPGMRDIRTPLIVGYVFLADVWLLFFRNLPTSTAEFKDEFPAIATISGHVGPLVVGGALSLAAYLLGGVIVSLTTRVLAIRGTSIEASTLGVRQAARRVISFTHNQEIDELEFRLKDLVDRELSMIADEDVRTRTRDETSRSIGESRMWFRVRRPPRPDQATLPPDVYARVEAKSGRIDDRILAKSAELFNEISRSRSEADLRAGLIPVLLLFVIAAGRHVPWSVPVKLILAGAAIVVLFLMYVEALQLRSRARTIATRAVVDELVSTPTIDLIRLRRAQSEDRPQPSIGAQPPPANAKPEPPGLVEAGEREVGVG
jgi:hypothetical protein